MATMVAVDQATTPYANSESVDDKFNENANNDTDLSKNNKIVYDVEHLATFSSSNSSSTEETRKQQREENDLESQNSSKTTTGQVKATTSDPQDKTTTATHMDIKEPRVALQKLFELEKLSGIWTQRMQIEFQIDLMLIIDSETNAIVERFCKNQVTKPEAFNQYNDIYNNIIAFTIEHNAVNIVGDDSSGEKIRKNCDKNKDLQLASVQGSELHIFQCVSHKAQQLVSDILAWKQKSNHIDRKLADNNDSKSMASNSNKHSSNKKEDNSRNNDSKQYRETYQSRPAKEDATSKLITNSSIRNDSQIQDKTKSSNEQRHSSSNNKPPVVVSAAASKSSNGCVGDVPIVNVNVKETVQVFNQIAALREKSIPTSSPTNQVAASRPLSDQSIDSTAATENQAQEATNAASNLSQGAQLYKQRSMRAILAPNGAAATPPALKSEQNKTILSNNNNQPLSSTSSSQTATAGASSSVSLASTARHQAANNARAVSSIQQQQQQQADSIGDNQRSSSSSGEYLAGQKARNARSAKSTCSGVGQSTNKQSALSSASNIIKSSKSRMAPPAPSSSSSSSQARNNSPPTATGQQQHIEQHLADQVATNESYVSVLNHCFDDIEKFIIRLQQAFSATRELQAHQGGRGKSNRRQQQQNPKRLPTGGSSSGGLLNQNGNSVSSSSASSSSRSSSLLASSKHHQQLPLPPIPTQTSSGIEQLTQAELVALSERARGPIGEDYFEILSKFKLAFNLLAKLKGCIHEPNAPELVHFLFTPLAIIIESARTLVPPIDPTLVGIPYLNQDALDLLSNCCTSKESDLWLSLGPNWTQTIDLSLLKSSRLPTSFQPIFSDGWAPVINELELIGLPSSFVANAAGLEAEQHYRGARRSQASTDLHYGDPTSMMQESSRRLTSSRDNSNARRRVSPTGESIPLDQQVRNGHRHSASARHSRSTRSSVESHYHSQSALDGGHHQPFDKLMHASPEQSPDDFSELTSQQSDQLLVSESLDFAPAGSRHHHHGKRLHPQHEQMLLMRRQYRSSDPLPANSVVGGRPPRRGNDMNKQLRNGSAYGVPQQMMDSHYLPPAPLPSQDPAMIMPYYHHQHQHQHQHHDERHYRQQAALAYVEREAMLQDLGPAQTEWFYELQGRDALIVRVLFTREANNDKELSVRRGELLEVLDDSRKWWKTRNIELQVAHVPHTIVAIMNGYQTLNELLTNTTANELMLDHHAECNDLASSVSSQHHRHRSLNHHRLPLSDASVHHSSRQVSKAAAGAFRYF